MEVALDLSRDLAQGQLSERREIALSGKTAQPALGAVGWVHHALLEAFE